jgi:hypothetical protein
MQFGRYKLDVDSLPDLGEKEAKLPLPARAKRLTELNPAPHQVTPIDGPYHATNWRGFVHGTICESWTLPRAVAQLVPVWLINSILDELAGARVKGRAHALLAILIAIVIVGTLLSSSGSSVIAQTSMGKQAQCELSAMRDTRSALAIQVIRSACNWLALNGDSLLNERSKNYYVCLAQQLSGVRADQAARAIVSACRTSYPP